MLSDGGDMTMREDLEQQQGQMMMQRLGSLIQIDSVGIAARRGGEKEKEMRKGEEDDARWSYVLNIAALQL